MSKTRSGKFARDYYQTAKDLDPRHGKPHFNLGILASEQQRHFEAIIHFIRAASVDKGPDFSNSSEFKLTFLYSKCRGRYTLQIESTCSVKIIART